MIGGIALYMGHKKQKQRKQTLAQIQEEEKRNRSNNTDPEGPEGDPEKHPHSIYRPAPYHHDNSKDSKSPGPIDGQRCLDYSVPHIDKKGILGRQRYGIENNNFIALKQTAHRLYHGHLSTWKNIPRQTQKVLQRYGCVKNNGQIIKNITEKSSI
jgi:hypothetical protein